MTDEKIIIYTSSDGTDFTREEFLMMNKDNLIDLIMIINIRLEFAKDEIDCLKKESIMPDNSITIEDIIVSIKLRLSELDLEIFDAKKKYIETMDDINSYESGYIYGKFESLRKENRILKKIMSDYYNGIESE